MEHIIAVQTEADFLRYHAISQRFQQKLDPFLRYLKTEYAVTDLPNAILWTSEKIATHSISNVPLPAYTNEFRTVFCPDLDTWREIYLHQLDDADNEEVRRYYRTSFTENHILQILGHEFVHHSDLFIDEVYETTRWFEEGMCEFISRKYFLTDTQFHEAAHINALLVDLYQKHHDPHSLSGFGADTYLQNYAGILCAYWRSFLAVRKIVEMHQGDVLSVFRSYRKWYRAETGKTLAEWFDPDT